MFKRSLLASSLVHLGFFSFLLMLRPSHSPEAQEVEVALIETKQQSRDDTQVIPRALYPNADPKVCPYTYGGIGIESGAFDTVTKVFEGYPADRAGMQAGDIMSYVGEIRGKPGTKLEMTITRKEKTFHITLLREEICYY